MCSFLIAGFLLANMTAVFNDRMQRRGPDLTTRVVFGGLEFVHNLLHLTGPMTQQPLLAPDGSAATTFNGEIYNHAALGASLGVRDGASDGEILIPAYRRWGANFVRELDGEYALAIADIENQIMLIATDAFGTKPLWLARDSGDRWAIASYRSALISIGFSKVDMIGPNTVLKCRLPLLNRCERIRTFRFDLRQYKDSTKDWKVAFSRAVAKRALQGLSGPRPNLFLGLSSGHDSGAIHTEVLSQRRPHAVYAILGPEAPAVVNDRIKLAQELDGNEGWATSAVLSLTNEQWWWEKAWLAEHAELYETLDSEQTGDGLWDLHDDVLEDRATYAAIENPSFVGLSAVCRQAAASGRRIMLSGQGADETMTNYADRGQPLRDHIGQGSFRIEGNAFNGFYPERLSNVFPWNNFFRGANRDFMQTVEAACGAHGVEARYPFLDPMVVQEWLWLTPAAKHATYKAPVEDLLGENGYPFLQGIKAGFGSRDHIDEDRFHGRAWVNGNALGQSFTDANELPPAFVPVTGELPHEFGQSYAVVLCHRKVPKGLGNILRNMWLKAASYGMYELLGLMLGRCCYRGDFSEEESAGCAVTLLNARQLSGVTALMAANERNDVDTAKELQRLACSLPAGMWRAAVLGAGTNAGTATVVSGGRGLEMVTALCEDTFAGSVPPSGDSNIGPLRDFLTMLINFLGQHGISVGSTIPHEELVHQVLHILED